jgi:FkbM family methyltransferase
LMGGADSRLRLFPWVNGMQLLGLPGYSNYFRNGLHEFADQVFLLHYLQKDDLFIDGGANIGVWSLLAASYRGARALAIEPAENTRRALSANIALAGLSELIEIVPTALAQSAGTAHMSGAGLSASVNAGAAGQGELVQLRTLADVIEIEGKGVTPALVKLDLEGFELPALRGAGPWISEARIPVLCLEANTADEAKVLYDFMTPLGYSMMYYLPLKRRLVSERPNPCLQYNLIFVLDRAAVELRLQSAPPVQVYGHRI